MKWIPHSRIKNLVEIAKGGLGIIYKAILLSNNETVAVKKTFLTNIPEDRPLPGPPNQYGHHLVCVSFFS